MFYPLLEQYDVDEAKALAYGFEREGGGLVLRRRLEGTEFCAVIRISGRSLEVTLEDEGGEYLPFNVKGNETGYVSAMREKAALLLEDMKGKCLRKTDARQLLMDYCSREFGTVPEAPWEDTPDYFTFKTARRKKWYALFMTIPYKSLGLEREGKLDVLNLKAVPDEVARLIDRKSYFPAYHMNKKYWLTVVLDKDADVQAAQALLRKSYALAEK